MSEPPWIQAHPRDWRQDTASLSRTVVPDFSLYENPPSLRLSNLPEVGVSRLDLLELVSPSPL